MSSFWAGFYKKADSMNRDTLTGQTERDHYEGTEGSIGRAGGEDTRTDKTLVDRERGPRSYETGDQGPEFQDEANPHIKY
jgi:hypothetical protein